METCTLSVILFPKKDVCFQDHSGSCSLDNFIKCKYKCRQKTNENPLLWEHTQQIQYTPMQTLKCLNNSC